MNHRSRDSLDGTNTGRSDPLTPIPPALNGAQRKHLRGLAHGHKPVVQVGQRGLTDDVVAAVVRALEDHELIKVRLIRPDDKKALSQGLAAACGAHLCGLVGHTVILYRRHPKKPRVFLPEGGAQQGTGSEGEAGRGAAHGLRPEEAAGDEP